MGCACGVAAKAAYSGDGHKDPDFAERGGGEGGIRRSFGASQDHGLEDE